MTGKNLDDAADAYSLESVTLEPRVNGLHLRFEQLYPDQTRELSYPSLFYCSGVVALCLLFWRGSTTVIYTVVVDDVIADGGASWQADATGIFALLVLMFALFAPLPWSGDATPSSLQARSGPACSTRRPRS